MLEEFYIHNAKYIIFAHILSAIIWVGGMIAIKLTVHPSVGALSDAKEKLELNLAIMKRLLILVFPFIIILLVTAIIMLKGLNLMDSELKKIAYIKEGIWSVMLLLYITMIIIRSYAKKEVALQNYSKAKKYLFSISWIILPLNIILGISALMFGISIRGF